MGHNRVATVLFIGILVCVPMLALYHFGVFVEAAHWLADRLPRFLVLPEGGVEHCKLLQYSYYTGMAFSSAWLGMTLPQAWMKYLYLLAIAFLTFLMTPLLALNGILFEPFSGTLAAPPPPSPAFQSRPSLKPHLHNDIEKTLDGHPNDLDFVPPPSNMSIR